MAYKPPESQSLYTGPTAEDLDRIPAALKAYDQWILWRGADRIDRKTGEITGLEKIPIHPQTLYNADTTDPTTWGAVTQCIAALPLALEEWEQEDPITYRGGGIGFVFAADDPYAGIDFDHCVDPTTRALAAWAQAHVDALASYTELSPSGTGLHILVQGALPPRGRKKGNVEVYSYARFFTMSGQHVTGTPHTIELRQDELTAFHTAIFGVAQTTREHTDTVTLRLEDTALLDKARGARHGAGDRFITLWAGNTATYLSQSEADLGLCIRLAFWTQDAAQIDRLFRQSGLIRDKWDEQRGAQTYGERTIAEALARQTEHYRPKTETYQNRNGDTPGSEPDTLGASWKDKLNTTKSGDAKETFNNLALALESLAPWSAKSWYDVVRDRGMVGTAPLDDTHVWSAARAIEQHTAMPIRNLKLVSSALRAHCHQRPRDVIQEWLHALPVWDGMERLTEWLSDHAGVPKTAYSMAVARLLPVSMVARGLHPGIQCRSVVIFEGSQNIGKSKLVKTLAGEEWYREVSGTLEGKEAHMLMKGAWVVELSEMDVLLRTEESRVKSFITMCNDEYVPKYANDPVKLARRTVLVGTINPEGDGSYLRDQTGSTRYYPVRVGAITIADIAAGREQLFAEALYWFQTHTADWWCIPEDAIEELERTREERRKEGVYEGPRLGEWLAKVKAGTTEVTAPFHTEDVLRFCFNIPPERWNTSMKDQVGKAIGKFGWMTKSSRARGSVQRLWHPGV